MTVSSNWRIKAVCEPSKVRQLAVKDYRVRVREGRIRQAVLQEAASSAVFDTATSGTLIATLVVDQSVYLHIDD
jgi:hypothetical protein